MKKTSIIVPVYNGDKYIEICLNSLLAQTYQNYEIILIDDGSTDKTAPICDRYAAKNACIRVFHQENAGLSVARNNGIRHATGERITFVDSDDLVTPLYLEHLNDLMDRTGADVVVGSQDRLTADHHRIPFYTVRRPSFKERVTDQIGALALILYPYDLTESACGKLYKMEIFDRFQFKPGILFEDLELIPRIIESCERVAFHTWGDYLYVQTPHSIMREIEVERIRQHLDLISSTRKRYENEPRLRHIVQIWEALSYTADYERAIQADIFASFSEDYHALLRTRYRAILADPKIRLKFILKVTIAYISPRLFIHLVKWRQRVRDKKQKL